MNRVEPQPISHTLSQWIQSELTTFDKTKERYQITAQQLKYRHINVVKYILTPVLVIKIHEIAYIQKNLNAKHMFQSVAAILASC